MTGERAANAAAPGPWHYATLLMPCSRCDAASGEQCCWADGTVRRRFHFERYSLARDLAGVPLRRPSAPPIA
jgi:hypothetical protein